MINISECPVIFEQNVAWGDMDAFGHVNNAVYYRYIESARICYFEALNIFQQDIYTVVASSQCQYLRPLFYLDQLKIGARVEEMRSSAIRMNYILWSGQQQNIAARCEAVIVCVDKLNLQKIPMPENIRQNIKQIEWRVQHDI